MRNTEEHMRNIEEHDPEHVFQGVPSLFVEEHMRNTEEHDPEHVFQGVPNLFLEEHMNRNTYQISDENSKF